MDCPDNRRLIGRNCIFLVYHPIFWSSNKQHTVARFGTKARYRSLFNTTAKLIWLQTLIKELGFHLTTAPVLWCDNLGTIYLTSNPMYHSYTKHMDIDFYFVRDRVTTKTLQVQFYSSKYQLVNIFTKPLVSNRFFTL